MRLLDYRLVDEELPRLVAARLGTSSDVVQSMTERPARFGERVLAGLSGALPELTQPANTVAADLSAGYKRELESLIHAAAATGNVVILGRLGNAILGSRADVVRVFVYAPLEWRVGNVSESLGCAPAQARAEIGRIDEARRTIARDYYRLAWGDIHQYDLAVDTARYGIDGTAAVIAAAVGAAQRA